MGRRISFTKGVFNVWSWSIKMTNLILLFLNNLLDRLPLLNLCMGFDELVKLVVDFHCVSHLVNIDLCCLFKKLHLDWLEAKLALRSFSFLLLLLFDHFWFVWFNLFVADRCTHLEPSCSLKSTDDTLCKNKLFIVYVFVLWVLLNTQFAVPLRDSGLKSFRKVLLLIIDDVFSVTTVCMLLEWAHHLYRSMFKHSKFCRLIISVNKVLISYNLIQTITNDAAMLTEWHIRRYIAVICISGQNWVLKLIQIIRVVFAASYCKISLVCLDFAKIQHLIHHSQWLF